MWGPPPACAQPLPDPASAACLQAKRRAAEDVLFGLRALQLRGRLSQHLMEAVVRHVDVALPAAEARRPPALVRAAMLQRRELGLSHGLGAPCSEGEQPECSSAAAEEAAAEEEWEQSSPEGPCLLRCVGRLPLPALMQLHAFICLQLAWHFPDGEDLLRSLQVRCPWVCVLDWRRLLLALKHTLSASA